jgi:transposase-like protein
MKTALAHNIRYKVDCPYCNETLIRYGVPLHGEKYICTQCEEIMVVEIPNWERQLIKDN